MATQAYYIKRIHPMTQELKEKKKKKKKKTASPFFFLQKQIWKMAVAVRKGTQIGNIIINHI